MYGVGEGGAGCIGAGEAMTGYPEIAEFFEKSLEGTTPPAELAGAIKAMKLKPELCEKIPVFDETVWLIVQEYLNSGGTPADEECFVHACRLLERREIK